MSIIAIAVMILTAMLWALWLQGMAVTAMIEGVKRILQLAAEVNTAACCQRIRFVDIGKETWRLEELKTWREREGERGRDKDTCIYRGGVCMCMCMRMCMCVSSCVWERERENGEGEREICVIHCMPSCPINHILSHSNIAHFPTLSFMHRGRLVCELQQRWSDTYPAWVRHTALKGLSCSLRCIYVYEIERKERGREERREWRWRPRELSTDHHYRCSPLAPFPALPFFSSSLQSALSLFFILFYSCCTNTWHITKSSSNFSSLPWCSPAEFGKALIAKCGVIVASVEDTIHHSPLPPLSSPSVPSSSSATSSSFSTSAASSSSYPSSSSPSSSTTNTREELQNNRLQNNVSNSRDATVVCNVYDKGEVKGREEEGEGRIEDVGRREGEGRRESDGRREGEDGSISAIIHAGADLLLRTAYCPDKFPHRVVLLK